MVNSLSSGVIETDLLFLVAVYLSREMVIRVLKMITFDDVLFFLESLCDNPYASVVPTFYLKTISKIPFRDLSL
jgi:hypothetical protein